MVDSNGMAISWSTALGARGGVRGGGLVFLAAWGLAAAAPAQMANPPARAAESAPAPPGTSAFYEYEPLPEVASAPLALARIPGGTFQMGNSYSNFFDSQTNSLEGWAHELPVHAVPVSECFVGRFEVTNEELARTLQWAFTNGLVELDQTVFTNVVTNVVGGVTNVATNLVTNLYGTVRNAEGTKRELVELDATYCQIAFTNGAFAVAAGKTNFPAIHVTWHGALAFGNYLSDREGLARAVDFAPADWAVDVAATGYRLPTEAEWEKACRGGNPGTHFPWPDDSAQGTNLYLYNVDPVKANYWDFRYGALTNHPGHPWFGEPIRTTPVGYYDGAQVITNLTTNFSFSAGTAGADFGQTNDVVNGYGLYDVAGNVYEWCWDYHATNWYADPAASLPDPTGPAASASFHTQRVVRGGGYTYYIGSAGPDPSFLRCAFHTSLPATLSASYLGFRVARRPTAYETWALGEGLDPLGADGGEDEDFDGDGFPNGDERLTGTQPTNSASFFQVAGVGPVTGTVPVAYWGASGRVYAVESATNLAQTNGWQFLVEVTNDATGASQIPVAAAEARRYLRIKARMAP